MMLSIELDAIHSQSNIYILAQRARSHDPTIIQYFSFYLDSEDAIGR